MSRNRIPLEDNQISAFINEELQLEDFEDDSASETEDYVEEDHVQEDENYELSDSEDLQMEEQVIPPDPSSIASERPPSSRIIELSQASIRGKNRHTWATSKGQSSARTSIRNIVRTSRGPSRSCRGLTGELHCFEKFFTDELFEEIVKWTNVEINVKRSSYESITATQKDTNVLEIKALVGTLILSAALKDNHLTTEEIFSKIFCGIGYVAALSRERFDFLVRCLRFDDRNLRLQLSQTDPFTPIRAIWNILIAQCRSNYIPGTNVTIDEQLLGFRGRCKFRMYIPNKPAKYGIKIEMMCDSGTYYTYD
ncbi:piggyBac transposable element-derived protein 4-like [Amyelois transitella]|uniref:piggyBac transposable element-derived protein 4-like n=1 Tax=Amyelois transitella TaxID=680683 RepID=UPI00298FF794|nr:piggyBac transposable element-derived protein 4-like [Amyelois transitella]